jgi:kinesin family protein C2/C3
VYDLLNDNLGGGQTDGISLDIRMGPDNTVSVPDLKQVPVTNMDEVNKVFNRGAKNRATATTNLNNNSSRSHLIIQVEVTIEETENTVVKGRLFLVDLAGSERLNKSGAKGVVLKEAQYINKSLSALGDVMEALDQKQKHIPYR